MSAVDERGETLGFVKIERISKGTSVDLTAGPHVFATPDAFVVPGPVEDTFGWHHEWFVARLVPTSPESEASPDE